MKFLNEMKTSIEIITAVTPLSTTKNFLIAHPYLFLITLFQF